MTLAPTAAVIIIGDEVLSGRTRDKNLGFIADTLAELGIDLKEARCIGDREEAIVTAVNELRRQYDYVFTTGGIGPTHDDITTDAVAKAFGLEVEFNQIAVDLLHKRAAEMGRDLHEASLRMARIPVGASLIDNPVSKAPGFRLENVFVMAGVPSIMQAMMVGLSSQLRKGVVVMSRGVNFLGGESIVATELEKIQNRYPTVSIGSYPFLAADGHATNLVLRSRDVAELESAFVEVQAMAEKYWQSGMARGWSVA